MSFAQYGGDASRKMKLLQKQKEGKKRMKMIGKLKAHSNSCSTMFLILLFLKGNVELPQKAFYDFMDKSKGT